MRDGYFVPDNHASQTCQNNASSINQLERNVHAVNVGRARTIGLVTEALFLSSPRLALYTRSRFSQNAAFASRGS